MLGEHGSHDQSVCILNGHQKLWLIGPGGSALSTGAFPGLFRKSVYD